jgi:Domain of unknown function (DUF2017)
VGDHVQERMNVTADGGTTRVELDREEAALLRNLIAEMRTLMNENTPGDRVLERLMPAAYEDPHEQAKYKEVVGDSLRQAKLDALDVVDHALEGNGDVQAIVTEEQAPAWLGVIADIRLALATRVGVTQEMMDRELDPSDPVSAPLSIVHWLAWLQESMIETLDPT